MPRQSADAPGSGEDDVARKLARLAELEAATSSLRHDLRGMLAPALLVADRLLAAPASQDRHVELGDLQRALLHLPQPQREALILVGAGGFAYEEAAEICGVAVGTIKSRVARGRVALEAILTDGALPSRREHLTDTTRTALDTIMGEVDELSRER